MREGVATINFHNGKRWSHKGKFDGYKTHASMKRLIDYITDIKKGKTREDLIKGFNCDASHAYEEFILNKELYHKTEDGERRMCIHFTQDFAVDDDITLELASQIAEELLQHEMFQGFQIVYATHMDAGHIHTHFVIDTINKETGKAWHSSKKDVQRLKDYSDELCRKYNLSVCERPEKKTVYKKKDELEVTQQGRSWKEEIRIAATLCAYEASNRSDFLMKMKELDITVNWTDARKYIVFCDKDGHRIRNIRLEPKELFTKEGLEKQFQLNRQYKEIERSRQLAEQGERLEAAQGIHNILYIAKTLMQSGESYPLQGNHEIQAALDRARTEAARMDYQAEQKKGRGI